MASLTLSAITSLINTFDKKPVTKITVTKRVVKVEKFSDDYNDFDMNALKNNKELMQKLLAMEEGESKNEKIPIIKRSHLPSNEELKFITSELSKFSDIKLNEESSIKNYKTKFKIDRFQFGVQFMIFPKSFINAWLGLIGTITQNQINIVKEHYLSNLMISIPHRKPLSDEYGQTSMSSMSLLSSSFNQDSNEKMSSNEFQISSDELALKLSKILTKISKCTVQISVDIPMQILNAPIAQRNRFGDATTVVFEIQQAVMNIYNNLKTMN